MDAHRMRTIIEDMFASFSSSFTDPDVMLKHMHPDGSWWVAGSTPVSGTKTRDQFLEALSRLPTLTESGMLMQATSFMFDGNRACVEAVSEMKMRDGRIYANQYCYIFEFEGDRIIHVREFMDTQLANDVYCNIQA